MKWAYKIIEETMLPPKLSPVMPYNVEPPIETAALY